MAVSSWGYPAEPEVEEGHTQIVVPVDRTQDVVDYLNGDSAADLLLVQIEDDVYVDPKRIQGIVRLPAEHGSQIALEGGVYLGCSLSPSEVIEVLREKLFD